VPEKTSVGLVYLGSFNTDYIICRNVEIIPQKINLKEKINCEGNYRSF
jgi:hypothetical protein